MFPTRQTARRSVPLIGRSRSKRSRSHFYQRNSRSYGESNSDNASSTPVESDSEEASGTSESGRSRSSEEICGSAGEEAGSKVSQNRKDLTPAEFNENSKDYSSLNPDVVKLYKSLTILAKDSGSFAYTEIFGASPNPGLAIQDHGLVHLPISDTEAAALYSLGATSPFGRREKTIVDEGVRSSRQFDAAQVQFENPGWELWIQDILKKTSKALGIGSDQKAEAHFYKFLVYREGGHFTAHRDSPKERGMVATLAVTLPSCFSGGRLKLSHNDEEKVVDFASSCKFDVGVAAWYSDVLHEVTPVTQGYRLVLIYNLCVKEPARATAIKVDAEPTLLQALKEIRKTQKPVAFVLENSYSQSQRKVGFKGQDRTIITHLSKAVDQIGGLAFFSAGLDIMVEDQNYEEYNRKKTAGRPPKNKLFFPMEDDYGDNYQEILYTFKNLIHIAGVGKHTLRKYTSTDFMQNGVLTFGSPISHMKSYKHEEQDTGNEGTQSEDWYKTSCIVIWPEAALKSLKSAVKHHRGDWKGIKQEILQASSDHGGYDPKFEYAKVEMLISLCVTDAFVMNSDYNFSEIATMIMDMSLGHRSSSNDIFTEIGLELIKSRKCSLERFIRFLAGFTEIRGLNPLDVVDKIFQARPQGLNNINILQITTTSFGPLKMPKHVIQNLFKHLISANPNEKFVDGLRCRTLQRWNLRSPEAKHLREALMFGFKLYEAMLESLQLRVQNLYNGCIITMLACEAGYRDQSSSQYYPQNSINLRLLPPILSEEQLEEEELKPICDSPFRGFPRIFRFFGTNSLLRPGKHLVTKVFNMIKFPTMAELNQMKGRSRPLPSSETDESLGIVIAKYRFIPMLTNIYMESLKNITDVPAVEKFRADLLKFIDELYTLRPRPLQPSKSLSPWSCFNNAGCSPCKKLCAFLKSSEKVDFVLKSNDEESRKHLERIADLFQGPRGLHWEQSYLGEDYEYDSEDDERFSTNDTDKKIRYPDYSEISADIVQTRCKPQVYKTLTFKKVGYQNWVRETAVWDKNLKERKEAFQKVGIATDNLGVCQQVQLS